MRERFGANLGYPYSLSIYIYIYTVYIFFPIQGGAKELVRVSQPSNSISFIEPDITSFLGWVPVGRLKLREGVDAYHIACDSLSMIADHRLSISHIPTLVTTLQVHI